MPEELIFFALIIFFSVLDGLLRKKKTGEVQLPDYPDGPGDWDDEAPTLEAPPTSTRRTPERGPTSFDDPSIPGRPMGEYTKPYGTARGRRPAPAESGVPGEVWEEIARLARGERAEPVEVAERYGGEAEERDVERRATPVVRTEVGTNLPAPIGRREVGTRADLFEHPVHVSHAGYGTDPSERPQNVAVVEGERASHDVRAVRSMLGGGRHQLRRAVILQEMLGPPVSLRDPDDPGAL